MKPRTDQAAALMLRFADRTGLTSRAESRRYLWTDAFAVCNFLGLARATGDAHHQHLALDLVRQVHSVLGRHRGDDGRTGWLSGLPDAEGERHPTRGGLRIGKPLPERPAGARVDERSEWDRDGQYFHYLTKWMHALDQAARATGRLELDLWARELAEVAHRKFSYGPPEGRRMHWKMSIDLTHPQIASMGHHDPLDGLITCVQLDATTAGLPLRPPGPRLADAAGDFATMIDPDGLATTDPLGLGGLLVDAYRIEQLGRQGVRALDGLGEALRDAAAVGLRHYQAVTEPDEPASRRLGFRELGLAIGLAAVELMDQGAAAGLARFVPLRAEIESFWLDPEHRRAPSWLEHEDINEVMLATSLVPDGFLVLVPLRDG